MASSSRKLPGGPPLIVPRTKGVGATGSSTGGGVAAAPKVSPEYRDAIKVLSDATMREACRLLLSERDYQPPKTEQESNDKEKSLSDHEQLLALYVKVKKASEVVLREAPDEDVIPSSTSTSGNAAATMKGAPSIPSIPAARAAAASVAALSSSSSTSTMLKPASKMFGKTLMTMMPAPQRIGGVGVGRMFPPPPPASVSAGPGMPPGTALKRAPLHRETSDGSGGSGSGSGGRGGPPSSGPPHPPPYARMMAGPKPMTGIGGGSAGAVNKKPKAIGAVGVAGGPQGSGARSSPPETTSAASTSNSMAAPPPPPPSALDFLAKLNRETPPPSSDSPSNEDRAASSSKSKGSTSTSSLLGKRGPAAAPSAASMSPPKKPKSAAAAQSDSGDDDEEEESSEEEEPDDDDEAKDESPATSSSRLRKRTTTTTSTAVPPSPDDTQRTPPTRTQPSRASRRNA